MNNHLILVKPQAELKDEYLSYYQEWKASGEAMIPWVISKDPSDFSTMLNWLSDHEIGKGLPDGWVPCSTFWLIDTNRSILGVVNIRHQLTEFLFNAGGHIGYGIRPSERRKGNATKILELALIEAKKLGIDDLLVVCDANNIGSEKAIVKNGGIPDSDYVEEDGNVIKRYWLKA